MTNPSPESSPCEVVVLTALRVEFEAVVQHLKDAKEIVHPSGTIYQRALSIREQHLGANHHDTASSLNSLAGFYYAQGKYVEAEPLYVRALAIYEQQVGAEHPTFQAVQANYTSVLKALKEDKDAPP